MKYLIYALLSILTVGCFSSCSEDGPVQPEPQPIRPHESLFEDGELLRSFDLSYIVKRNNGYDGFQLITCATLGKYEKELWLESAVQAKIEEIEWEYLEKKFSFVQSAYDQFISTNPESDASIPAFFTAYINGEVRITCDKTLFGKEPGTPLNEFFKLWDDLPGMNCQVVGIENPMLRHNFGEEQPSAMNEIFIKEAWLSRDEFRWVFTEAPSEKYDEITFFLTIPVLKEYTREYALTIFDGEKPEKIYSEEILTSKCTIYFAWDN